MNNGCSVNKKKNVNILGLCVILALLQSAKSILKHCYRSGNSLRILHGRLSQLDLCGGGLELQVLNMTELLYPGVPTLTLAIKLSLVSGLAGDTRLNWPKF